MRCKNEEVSDEYLPSPTRTIRTSRIDARSWCWWGRAVFLSSESAWTVLLVAKSMAWTDLRKRRPVTYEMFSNSSINWTLAYLHRSISILKILCVTLGCIHIFKCFCCHYIKFTLVCDSGSQSTRGPLCFSSAFPVTRRGGEQRKRLKRSLCLNGLRLRCSDLPDLLSVVLLSLYPHNLLAAIYQILNHAFRNSQGYGKQWRTTELRNTSTKVNLSRRILRQHSSKSLEGKLYLYSPVHLYHCLESYF